MRISPYNATSNFKGSIINSATFKKGLEFASDNSALFCATVAAAFQFVARPVAIMMTPKADKENKKYAASKSIASSVVGYALMAGVSIPVSKAIKNIDNNPKNYLTTQTIKNLQDNSGALLSSKKYQFITQLFKLGLGCLIAIPKSSLTSKLIPKIIGIKKDKSNKNETSKQVSFKGNIFDKANNELSKGIANIINYKPLQKLAYKLQNTSFELHMMNLTDVVLTGAFVSRISKNDKIKEERKKPLIYNSILSTGISVLSSYSVNKLIDKSFKSFIEKYKKENAGSLKLDKYIQGLNIAKLSLIMGGMYYVVIPVLSTFFSDLIDKKSRQTQKNN